MKQRKEKDTKAHNHKTKPEKEAWGRQTQM